MTGAFVKGISSHLSYRSSEVSIVDVLVFVGGEESSCSDSHCVCARALASVCETVYAQQCLLGPVCVCDCVCVCVTVLLVASR